MFRYLCVVILVTFFCFAKKKVTKEKATPVCRRCAVPCVARLVRRLRNSRYALRQSSPKSPDQPALLGGAQGKVKPKTRCRVSAASKISGSVPVFRSSELKRYALLLTKHNPMRRTFWYGIRRFYMPCKRGQR